LNNLAKKMILTICALSLIFVVISAVYYRSISCLPFIFGVLIGTIVSVIKVMLLSKTVDKALSMEEKAASRYVNQQHFLRLLLTAAALLLGALVSVINLWGVVAGVFAFQISVYVMKIIKAF
jgi:multisubunit Na+/H+ antiporter MnhE subunit